MQLHNLLRPLQKEANRLVKSFLDENPELMKKYVGSGVTAISLALTPLNVFMRHLVVIQGLDPDTLPGEKNRVAFLEALENFFDKRHEKSFDADYDFSWIQKRFEDTRKSLEHLELTKEKFMDLTDLAKIPVPGYAYFADEPVEVVGINDHNKPCEKKEIPLDTPEGRQEYRKRVISESIQKLKEDAPQQFDPITDLRRAVENIEREVGLNKTKKGVKTSKKKLNKAVNKSIKKGPGVRVRKISDNVSASQPSIKQEVLLEQIKTRAERSKKLVDEMVDRGLVENTQANIKKQLEEILLWNEEALFAMERVIQRHFKKPVDDKFTGSFKRVQK